MNPLALIPYALAAYGGIQGYKGARQSGVGGLGSLVHGALGAYTGYNLGQLGGIAKGAGFGTTIPTFANIPGMSSIPGVSKFASASYPGMNKSGEAIFASDMNKARALEKRGGGSILDLLRNKDAEGNIIKGYDPLKVGGSLAALTYLGGAFDNQPTDIFMPGYNMSYLDLKEQRPGYTYIDPTTGQEVAYQKIYSPEEG